MGDYCIVSPVAALKDAMNGRVPAVYAERLPIPQPAEWDVAVTVAATEDGVPVLQRADLGSVPVRAPLSKGEDFDAVMLVLGNDRRWYWVSRLGSRIPVAGTATVDGPLIAGAAAAPTR